jgi:endoribonuclease Dicer
MMIRYDVALKSVGPYGADYYLHKHLTSSMVSLRSAQTSYLTNGYAPHAIYSASAIAVNPTAPSGGLLPGKNYDLYSTLITAVMQFNAYIHDDFEMSPSWLSPKVLATVRILQRHRTPTFHCIIFVEQRQVAAALSWLLMRHPDTKDWIRSAVITGHGGPTGGDALGMTESGQKQVVKEFREGKLNLRKC